MSNSDVSSDFVFSDAQKQVMDKAVKAMGFVGLFFMICGVVDILFSALPNLFRGEFMDSLTALGTGVFYILLGRLSGDVAKAFKQSLATTGNAMSSLTAVLTAVGSFFETQRQALLALIVLNVVTGALQIVWEIGALILGKR